MSALLLENRTLAEVVGALVLMVDIYLAWIYHDHAEQAIGAHTCEALLT
jgi:low temperature requirement protein LtrA